MTVGIAATCESESDDPRVVLAADRLVTTRIAARIEYEHTNSKMVAVAENDHLTVMGIAAGSMSLADDLFFKLNGYIDGDEPEDVRTIVEHGIDAYQDLLRETIERQVLKPNGFTLSGFNSGQQQLNPQIAQGIYQDILQKQEDIRNGLHALIAGVDDSGAHIYSIVNGDMARFDTIGHHCVGMGAEPANSSFVRARYNDGCTIDEALLSVVDAKFQAERAQGVGREMDIAVISRGDRTDLDPEEVRELREIQKEIAKRQKEARESAVRERHYAFGG